MAARSIKKKIQLKNLAERKVKFPHKFVFQDIVKDGDSGEMVNFLKRPSVDSGIVNGPVNEKGQSALHELVLEGNLKCIKILLNIGGDVNQKDETGSTPLHYSVRTNNMEITRVLVQHGASAEIQDTEGHTPLDYTDDYDMLELLTLYSPELEEEDDENS